MSSSITTVKSVMERVRKVRRRSLRAQKMTRGNNQYISPKAPSPKAMALAGQTKPSILPNPQNELR